MKHADRRISCMKMCKNCEIEKPHIFLRQKPSKQGNVYVDDTGKQWYGAICSSCVPLTRSYSKDPTKAKSHRKCRKCNKRLTMDRYFNCIRCKPDLNEDSYEDFMDNSVGYYLPFSG